MSDQMLHEFRKDMRVVRDGNSVYLEHFAEYDTPGVEDGWETVLSRDYASYLLQEVLRLAAQLRTVRAQALADVHSRFMDQAEILEAKSIGGSKLPAAHEMLEKLKRIVWDMLNEAEQASAGAEGEDGNG